VYIDYEAWERAGAPERYVWGANFADAYPGLSYVNGSSLAAESSNRLAREMHEIVIDTNAFLLRLVFHDFIVEQVAAGDPASGELRPLNP
jgi:hypothetical protein